MGLGFFFTVHENTVILSKSNILLYYYVALYYIIGCVTVLLLYAGFQRIDADQDLLRSDWIVSGVPVVRLLAIQAGYDTQRDAGYGGIRQSDQFAHHVSNNGIIRIICIIRRYMKL